MVKRTELLAVLAVAAGLSAGSSSPVWASETEPYDLTLALTPKAMELKGDVPDDTAKAAIVEAASKAFPDLPLTIVLGERSDAPAGFAAATLRAMDLLTNLAEGEATIGNDQVVFSGAAYHQDAKSELDQALTKGWPAGYRASATSVAAGPSGPSIGAVACERGLKDVLGDKAIEFEAGRADIAGSSRSLLDRVAYETLRCPDALIAVAGHTDSDGTDEKNYGLSLDRARTVVDLLVADGIAVERFTALGYGESRPLASNATEAGKARNRRIEFVLRD
jgi:OOP family OmpA-OmpF porin